MNNVESFVKSGSQLLIGKNSKSDSEQLEIITMSNNQDDDDNEERMDHDPHEPLITVDDGDRSDISDKNKNEFSDDDDINIDSENSPLSNNKCCQCLSSFINGLDSIDKKLSSYIFKWSPGKVVDCLIAIPCLAFSYFGFPVWIIVYIIIMQSYLYALCVLVSIVVTQIMKRCIKRKRPKTSDLGERWFYLGFEDVSADHSFPSGDVSQAAVFSVTLGYSIDSFYWLGLICVVPFVALGRIYFGRHYIGDTIGGAFAGVAVGYCVNFFLVHHMYKISNYI